MSGNYRSVFDIIGPVMIGPSSSHTAGAVAIGQAANKLFGGIPDEVTVHYYGSFAQTHKGHGTDYAITAGVMGFETDDPRVPNSQEIAKKMGLEIEFIEEPGDSPINHPNTAVLDMVGRDKKMRVSGCSIGGGAIEIREIMLRGMEIRPAGPLPIILYIDSDKNKEKELALTKEIERIAPFENRQVLQGKECNIYEFNIKNYMRDKTKKSLASKYDGIICL